MKDVNIKIALLGDGMSGKTQILLTYNKIIADYLVRLHRFHSKEKSEEQTPNKDSSSLTPGFYAWTKQYGFIIEYGKATWNFSSISLDSETVGLEDFRITFPFFHNGCTYRIKLFGNDLGGQNIFDHFRAILGKMFTPMDNMIIVLDKSRKLSCYNSLRHIKETTGENLDLKNIYNSNLPKFWFVANKSDLENHIKNESWKKILAKCLLEKLKSTASFKLPSLIFPEGEENVINYQIANNQISFPDLEALVYNSIRESDKEYGSSLLSDVNTRAIAREIVAQLMHFQRKEIDYQDEQWEDFNHLIFKQRPLALQYARSVGILQDNGISHEVYDKVRDEWQNYYLVSRMIYKNIGEAINRTTDTDQIISQIGDFFSTNAIQGDGIKELFDSIIIRDLREYDEISTKKNQRITKRKITRF